MAQTIAFGFITLKIGSIQWRHFAALFLGSSLMSLAKHFKAYTGLYFLSRDWM